LGADIADSLSFDCQGDRLRKIVLRSMRLHAKGARFKMLFEALFWGRFVWLEPMGIFFVCHQ